MKLPDKEDFKYKECEIGGDKCWLIVPSEIGIKWDDDIARFRSIIVRQSDGFVVSQGLPKFVNWGERPDFQTWDESWKFQARHKYDGSCLIISKYKGELIIRTRGTTDARQMPNGYEIDLLIKKYPDVFDNEHLNKEYISIICEWITPTNIICLREFNEPTLVLLSIVKNENAEYENQSYLDYLGKLWGIQRPENYTYDSVVDCIADVDAWEGKEGVVLYSPDFQTLKKIKASQYLAIHKIATGMKSLGNILDLFLESPRFVEYQDFYNHVESTIDYEVAEKIKDDMKTITDAYVGYVHSVDTIKKEITNHISHYETRKEQAIAIQRNWTGWMVPVAFTILDNRDLDDKLVKKSMEALLEL